MQGSDRIMCFQYTRIMAGTDLKAQFLELHLGVVRHKCSWVRWK